MKPFIIATTLILLPFAAAHSWVHCIDHDNKDILEWMKANATKYGKEMIIDPLMPWYAHLCHGWPRFKQNPGDWVDETITYLWDLEGAAGKKDIHACHPDQRNPTYHLIAPDAKLPHHSNSAPMATATAGASIKLMFGGNGHSRGSSAGGKGDPGKVAIYWAGEKEKELVNVSELTPDTLVQENGFSEESFAFPADLNVWTPPQGLFDKGNWQTLRLPECMEKGRHMMVWVWSFGGKARFSTCFDVMIK
ncbi:hypothetical protein HBH98_081710 [Parastagonospora nodorum]|nr:hypothetical protein HBH53_126710 [Parastagonospora nodorum]KAH4035502.1 hypothetical protein HBI09_087670 [Parastagonospora nodorum]KAH4053105.1 hypothetical protein HBH49_095060 [Parastagonospora nodorum]KAH4105594.1 hypothetical protein HBH46_079990 [Parastagonospora nodorum]KAH4190636.1 hypothetical protein HBH42_131660 [Parastagonospora nodorum]